MDQPGKVANPALGQLDREGSNFLSAFAPEILVSRDGLGNPVPRQPAHLHTQAEAGAYLRNPPEFREGVHFLFKITIRHMVSPEFIGSRNCVPTAFTAESPPAQGQ